MSIYTIHNKNMKTYLNGLHMLFVFIVTLCFALGLIVVCYKYKYISSLSNVTYPVHGRGEHSQYSN